ncbi:hypothetical protein ACWCSD_03580 [Nonomuraea sp. NPDC001684]
MPDEDPDWRTFMISEVGRTVRSSLASTRRTVRLGILVFATAGAVSLVLWVHRMTIG